MRRIRVFRLAVAFCLAVPLLASASPVLQCVLTQGGETQTLTVEPTADPYRVAAVDVGRRFRFKAVVYREQASIAYVKLYTYYQSSRQAVLLHQASYHNPLAEPAVGARSLTGEQRLFSPNLGRELLYNCALLESRP